jgi:DMSO/TMAO reductase YedYZ molybdopterin-dependent catalytic subunit
MDEHDFKRMSRRELLKLSPILLAGVALIPPVRDRLMADALSLTDWADSRIFRKNHLAPTYADSQVAPPSKFFLNSFDVDDPEVDFNTWRLEVSGLVKKAGQYTLADIQRLPRQSQNVRHVCVEGWDVIANFAGTRISDFLDHVGADKTARFLYFECADSYYESLDMETALHPQSLLTYEMYGQPITREHGAPIRLNLPTKIGYKSAKYVTSIQVTNVLQRRGYWEDQGYDWNYSL